MNNTLIPVDVSKKPELWQIAKNVRDTHHIHLLKRENEPVAAVVPLEIYEQWEKVGDELLTIMDTAAKNANLSPEKADKIADEVVHAIRAGSQAAQTV